MNDKKTKEVDGRESVSMLPGVTVGVMIAVIAFVLSFDALRLVFVSSGINPLLSWGGPLCVDGTILLCTWATWGFRKGHIRGRWYPWAGLVLFSLFSVTGNALHAWLNAGGMLPTWGAPAIMSIPPIALLYSTHLIVIIAGDRQDKLARTTGKAAGPDDGHAGPAAATPDPAVTEPVRTENPRAIPTPTAGPEPGKATEPAPAGWTGTRLAWHRTRQGLSQAELAIRAGQTTQTIGGIETRRWATGSKRSRIILDLAAGLGVQALDLMDQTPEGKPRMNDPKPAKTEHSATADDLVYRNHVNAAIDQLRLALRTADTGERIRLLTGALANTGNAIGQLAQFDSDGRARPPRK